MHGTKEPVRVEDWEWDNQNSADTLGYNRPDAGNEFFGYKFPMEPESVREHTQNKQVCSLQETRVDVQHPAGINITQHPLKVQH